MTNKQKLNKFSELLTAERMKIDKSKKKEFVLISNNKAVKVTYNPSIKKTTFHTADLRFWDAKNKCCFSWYGCRDGAIFDNYEIYTGELPQHMDASKLED